MNCYVHIPFCDHICFYCDFCRVVSNKKEEYIQALEREVQSLSFSKLDTLYFGGGTPSSLEMKQLERISNIFKDKLSNNYEWTVECNPDSLSLKKCQLLKSLGVNRISLGVQSLNDTILASIGRKHTSKDVYTCIETIRDVGISNISIDLIYGLPNQTLQDIKKDLQCFLQLNLPHLSIYSLQIEENSVFGKRGIKPCDEDLEADMFEMICSTLKENGYTHYEISSFCKDDMYSRHNLCYWSDMDFIGIGCGASGRENGMRYDHTFNLNEYIENPLDRYFIQSTKEDRMFEAIMMSLRTTFGLDINFFNQKYDCDFYKMYFSIVEKYKDYFNVDQQYLSVNEKGMEILNTILIDFIKE